MFGFLLRLFGKRVAHKAIARHSGGLLDVKLGFALLRDRRVPLVSKLLALGIGAALTLAMLGLELPVEAIIGALLAGLPVPVDMAVDGLEAVIGPVLLGALLLPHLAPQDVVALIRDERDAPVIDIHSQEPPRTRRFRLAR